MASRNQSLFALSRLQTNFTTEQAIADDSFRMIAKEGYDPAEYGNDRADNAGFATGSAYATRSRINRHESGFPFSYPLSFEGMLFFSIMAWGDYTVDTTLAPAGGQPGVYLHKFKLLNPTANLTLPSRALAEKNGTIRDRRFPSMTIQEISYVRAAGDAFFRANGTLRGSGQKIRPSGVSFFGAGKDVINDSVIGDFEEEIVPGGWVLTLYPQINLGGTAFAVDPCDLRDFNIGINENLNTEIGYSCPRFNIDGDPQSGLIRGQLPPGNQEASAVFSMINSPNLVSSFDAEDKHEKNTLFSLSLVNTGSIITGAHRHKATFKLNRTRIGNLGTPDFDGVEGIEITAALEAQGDILPVELEIVSDVPDARTFVAKTA